ncbi:MAG: ThuA domain-containing protein [Acidobacteria bacterium]|nr:ThuA domain-containing protein [Acidobacteriota bacterium]
MKVLRIAWIALAAGSLLMGQSTPPAKKKRILAIGEVKGYQHESVSHALATIERLARESGIYDTYIRTDSQLLTKKKLAAKMIGGYFDGHPWGTFDAPILTEDRNFPATSHFPAAITLRDEIYQSRNFSRDNVRVLQRLDESRLDFTKQNIKRTDQDFAVTWVKNYGKGRVFYSSLGHTVEAWDDPTVRKMYLEAIKWALKLTEGDATPRPRP